MRKVFASKVDIALPILLVVSSIPAILIGITEKDWVLIALMVAVFAMVMYLLFDTYYVITQGILKVHSGFIVNKNISIESIKAIKKTDSILSAPASSLTERIEVCYGNSKTIIISPKEKLIFIAELQKQNLEIKVELQ